KAAMDAAVSSMKEKGVDVPIMLSFTQVNAEGNNLLGQNIYSFLDEVKDYPIFSVGMNCSTGADQMYPLIRELSERVDYYITAHPNAGLPDENGQYLQSPEIMQKQIWPYIDGHLVNVIGGCCGTNNEHIGKYAPLVEPAPGCFVTPHQPGQKTVATKTEKKPVKLVEKTVSQENTAEKGALFNAIIAGKTEDAKKATQQLIDEGKKPQEIINEQMIVAMSEIGQRFQNGKAFVPQLLMAGRAMKSGLELLKPLMAGSASISAGKVVIGTVKGDLHDIGKNLVASMLEGCGFEVINVGIDVPSEKFVEALKETNADILCMSALLTTTMTYMKDVIDAIKAAGLRDKVKIMVGGAPVSQNFADEIGADGYSDNANSAVALAKRLMQPS
ncbi:MAG: cobalamin-dependent protein, partial [Bacteroidaceae bacterium]|nr:cobalamin-dependent protein [Bacteroidaceae bacterium]